MRDLSFPPQTIRDYALIADGERGGLIGPRGDVVFLCAPRWHDDGVFSRLLGGAGDYAVTPTDDRFVTAGQYEPGSLIWANRWVTSGGVLECRDALAYPGATETMVLLRHVRAVEGDAEVRVLLDPRAGFGRDRATIETREDGAWCGRVGQMHFRWQGPDDMAVRNGSALVGQIRLREGDGFDLTLELSEHRLTRVPVDPEHAWRTTRESWASVGPELEPSLAPDDVRHSYAVLRGMTSTASGGMVASATTSLPERANRGRNYDYRYAWVRDQCYAGTAAAAVGGDDLLEHALTFVSERLLEDGPLLRPAYTVDGGHVPDVTRVDLRGYPGGGNRLGNWVGEQFQLDTFGEALLLYAAGDDAGLLTNTHRKAAREAAEAIAARRHEPDAGIWELTRRRWAHSRLVCAAGLRAMASRGWMAPEPWGDLADSILGEVDHASKHPSGRWQRAPDDPRVDAALLIPGLRGAVPPDDPRHVETWRAVRRELARDGFVHRFSRDDRELGAAEGAFLLCGFHMALATYQQGREVEAIRWFERNRGVVGPSRLFAEEYDVRQRQLRGNLPQAFVHALFVETATTLAELGEEARLGEDEEGGQ